MISSSTASQASAGPFQSLTLPIGHRRTTEPHVKGLTVSKQLTPEDGRSGVNPSHNSKHDHDCDGRGPIPQNCTELALSLSAQPPGRSRPGVALEPPIVAQLTCGFRPR
ncbi:hypothetical protein V502_00568 [Pseudogymnoascus sp. VKM F-4520 (FW-2644)]|nr:hypothetical protein V502_00568 [Pseudogymnoascus sp. VKM F-4520 (FW-2644)]